MEQKYKLDYPLIARRIKEAGKLTGLTQEQLAEKIDISTNAVAKLENNLMTPSLQTPVNISNVLSIDINSLFSQKTNVTGSVADEQFLNLLQGLSDNDKNFVIHMITGLIHYNAKTNEN